MIVIPASLRSDFIHIAGMTIHIALESTIHIVGIRNVTKYAIVASFQRRWRAHYAARSFVPLRALPLPISTFWTGYI